jgi:hypothetical protein
MIHVANFLDKLFWWVGFVAVVIGVWFLISVIWGMISGRWP